MRTPSHVTDKFDVLAHPRYAAGNGKVSHAHIREYFPILGVDRSVVRKLGCMCFGDTPRDIAGYECTVPQLIREMECWRGPVHPIIFADAAASNLKPIQVLSAMQVAYELAPANIHRAEYPTSATASGAFDHALHKLAAFLNANPDEVVAVAGATDGLNLFISSLLVTQKLHRTGLPLLDKPWGPDDTITMTGMEHNSVTNPLQVLCALTGAKLNIVYPDGDGLIDPARFPDCRLTVVTGASNVLGTRCPLGAIRARTDGLLAVDAAQSTLYSEPADLDVAALGLDMVTGSAHKMFGPTGVGYLFLRRELMEAMVPARLGGGTVVDVGADYLLLKSGPEKWMAGTQSIIGVIGMGAAVDFINALGRRWIKQHGEALTRRLLQGLASIEGVRVYGPPAEERTPTVAFSVENMNARTVSRKLEQADAICSRWGCHCAELLRRHLGLPKHEGGTTRLSLSPFTHKHEISAMIAAVARVAALARSGTEPFEHLDFPPHSVELQF